MTFGATPRRPRVPRREKGYDPDNGARPLGRVIQDEIKKPLGDELLFGALEHGGHLEVDAKDGKLVFVTKARIMSERALRVDIWSDIACPWCYVGKRRFEAALAGFAARRERRGHVARLRASTRRPPPSTTDSASYAARIAAKYGLPVADAAEQKIRQMTETAAADGLDFHFEKVQSGNTFDAHRVIHLAHERGAQDAVKASGSCART